jgi:MFS transporter, DHA1 family, multidrug resistance protein
VQAVGACAGVVLARAMVRDLYERDRAAQMLSTLMTVMAIAPLLGPLIGGQILALAGWQAIFWTLAGIGLLTLAGLFLLPETLPRAQRSGETLGHAFIRYGELVHDRTLLGYAGAIGFLYGGMFAYIAGTPFAYISYHHVSPQLYGVLFALGVVGLMATNLINARVVGRIGSDRLLRAGTVIAAVAGVALAVMTRTGWSGLAGLVAPLFVFISATGFIVANAIVGALARFPRHAGAVSALVGAVQYGSGMIGSALIGAFADGTPWPMGCVIALAGIGTAACTWLLRPTPATAAPAETKGEPRL